MPFTIQSPYGDGETRTKDVSKIVEEFIEANWDAVKTGVAATSVAFGKHGSQIQESGMPVTLRVYPFFEDVRPMDVSNHRFEHSENLYIDIYVMNNDLYNEIDPRAVKIRKWFDELFLPNEGNMPKGIYDLRYRGGRVENDPEMTNISRVKTRLDVRYITDVIETP